uniref:Alpha-ketoglutarate-dependent dioxygenase AlkB-like domain-containing protein n=1 Tax=Panagrolaimus superbus TaxID=310955 RepID=A0A914YWF3_9BILA
MADSFASSLPCACKGIRFCASCLDSERVKKLNSENVNHNFDGYQTYVFNPANQRCYLTPNISTNSSVTDIQKQSDWLQQQSSDVLSNIESFQINGLLILENFLNENEEDKLVKEIEITPWVLSQSGRRKQDYGPKVNFKHKKVKCDRFIGVPEYADELLKKMNEKSNGILDSYQPFELCNLEYEPSRLSAIELHQDDMWIWGNRLISLNLLSDSVMTYENSEIKKIVFVFMQRRYLLSMFDDARYKWKHGIFSHHIINRRIALTMREPAKAFQLGGELYEKYGKELIERGNIRIPIL